jgi:hypothetical protein
VEVTQEQKSFQELVLDRERVVAVINHSKMCAEYDSVAGILALGTPPTHLFYLKFWNVNFTPLFARILPSL